MKKISFKINSRTKSIILGLSVVAMLGLSSLNTPVATKAGTSFALVGLVASFKKKGIELSEDEEKHYSAMDEAFEAHTKGLVTAAELKEKFEEIKGQLAPESLKSLVDAATAELNESLAKHATAIDQLNTMSGNAGISGKGKTLKEQIKSHLESADIKTQLADMKSKNAGSRGFQFELKAGAAMTVAGTTAQTTAATALSFPQPEFIPGLNDVARNQPFLIQLLNVMTTNKETIIYTEKYDPQGVAGWVAENAAALEVDFDVRVGNSQAKMVSCFIEVSTQMLDDVDYMAAEIEKELMYQEAIKIDSDLLTGDGVGENLAGIDSFAGGYTLTTLSTTNPNNCDAILACATQIAKDNFRPDIACLNPIDYAQTKLIKTTTGEYVVNPNNSNNSWDGVRVVQSNQVPVGYVMVMDSSKTNLYRYKDLQISYGWVNDNFKKNMVTIMANQRLHFFIKSNDALGFIYDTLANVKAAIVAV